jgi:hypothetical protein
MTHTQEAVVKSVLANMVFNNKEIGCERVLGLDVYYIGTPPREFYTLERRH